MNKRVKPCSCEACQIEGRKVPGLIVEVIDGMGYCKEHAKIFERLKLDIEHDFDLDPEDIWN